MLLVGIKKAVPLALVIFFSFWRELRDCHENLNWFLDRHSKKKRTWKGTRSARARRITCQNAMCKIVKLSWKFVILDNFWKRLEFVLGTYFGHNFCHIKNWEISSSNILFVPACPRKVLTNFQRDPRQGQNSLWDVLKAVQYRNFLNFCVNRLEICNLKNLVEIVTDFNLFKAYKPAVVVRGSVSPNLKSKLSKIVAQGPVQFNSFLRLAQLVQEKVTVVPWTRTSSKRRSRCICMKVNNYFSGPLTRRSHTAAGLNTVKQQDMRL